MNALMNIAGFSTLNEIKNHCSTVFLSCGLYHNIADIDKVYRVQLKSICGQQ